MKTRIARITMAALVLAGGGAARAMNPYEADPVPGFGVDGHGGDQSHFHDVGRLEGTSCRSAQDYGSGLSKFYRGGQPRFFGTHDGQVSNAAGQLTDSPALKVLKERSIGLVIDLRHSAAGENFKGEDEGVVLSHYHIDYIRFPIPDDNAGVDPRHPNSAFLAYGTDGRLTELNAFDATRAVVQKIREALASGTHVFIHCVHGEDRTGTMVALFRDCNEAALEFGHRDFNGKKVTPAHDNYEGALFRSLTDIYRGIREDQPPRGSDYEKILEALKPLGSGQSELARHGRFGRSVAGTKALNAPAQAPSKTP